MAQVGRISGPLLTDNLLRKGTVQPASQANLSFRKDNDSDVLLKIDVNNGRIGVDVDAPVNELQISDTIRTVNLKNSTSNIANYSLSGSNINVDTGEIYLTAGEHIQLSNLETENFYASDNFILTKNTNENIEINPNGTGTTEIQSNLNIFGNLYTPGNITFGGTITFGDQIAQDTVQINSDLNSSIVPDLNESYDLGSSSKRWNELRTGLINGKRIETSSAIVATLDLALRSGNIFYVSVNGNDTNVGDHVQGPFRTIRRALEASDASVSGPVAIKIFPGVYEEQLPLTVPSNVSVIGEGIRSVTVKPAAGNEYKDVFHLNGETTVANLTVKDFYYDSLNNTGHAFRFAPGAVISSRSPYVQNVTVITAEGVNLSTPVDIYVDPEGLGLSYSSNSITVTQSGHSEAQVASWVGKTLVTYFGDGYPVSFYTVTGYIDEPQDPGVLWRIELAETFDSAQQGWLFSIYPNTGETIIVGTEPVATQYDFSLSFNKSSLPANFETTVGQYWTIQIGEGVKVVDYVEEDPLDNSKWRVYLTSTSTYTFGPPIFTSPSAGGTIPAGRAAWVDGSEMNSLSKEASLLFHSCTFITPNADAVTMTNGVRVEWLNSFTYFANRGLYAVDGLSGRTSQDGSTIIYGAELRSIGSANVYGNYGAVADGSGTLMYLVKHNFGYVGSGLDSSNDRTLAIQENEVVQLNGGKIYYQSTDHLGTFRVGNTFFVNSEIGTTNIDISALAAESLSGLIIRTGDNETILSSSKIETGNVRFTDNRLDSLSNDLIINSATNVTNIQDNTTVNGNTYIRDNFSFGGTLNLSGNEPTDALTFNVEFEQNFNPNQHLTFSLGSEAKKWKNARLTQAEVGNFSLYNNVVEVTESNADLELRANGTGKILFSSNDVELPNNITVNGLSSVQSVSLVGNLTHIGNRSQNGNISLTKDLLVDEVLISNNYITSTLSNSNLEIRAYQTSDITLDGSGIFFGETYDGGSSDTVVFSSTFDGGDSQGIVGQVDRRIYLPSNDLKIDNNLTVSGNIETQDIVITGTLTLSGNRTQTGSLTQLGSIDLNGFLQVDHDAQISDISFVNNVISTVVSNADLELRASNLGEIKFQSGNLILDKSISAADISATNLDLLETLTFNIANVSDITIAQNYIDSNVGDLILEASNSGKIIFGNPLEIVNDLTVNDALTIRDSFIDQGYGPELVRNGTFTSSLVNWTTTGGGTATSTGDALVMQAPIGVARIVSQSITVKPNTKYKFEADLLSFSLASPAGEVSLRVFQSGVGDLLLRSTLDIQTLGAPNKVIGTFFTGAPTTLTVVFRIVGSTVSWDNVSLVEDLGLIEFVNPLDVTISGSLSQTGNSIKTGNLELTGNLEIDGNLNISGRTDFSNYYIDDNVLANKRFGLSVLRTDAFNPFGFYSIIVAMSAGATADDYAGQTEKNLINFLANGTSVNDDYGFSYIDVNQSGSTTTSDSLAWLQFVANGTSGNAQTDQFIQSVVDQIIEIEFNNPGTFNKEALFFGDYFEPDIILKASGSGIVNFSRKDVRVNQDLFASSIVAKDIVIDDIINLNEIVINDSIVEIDDNFISTSISNTDLELRATKDVRFNDSLIIENNLTVGQTSNLKNTEINGLITHLGDKTQTGTFELTGNLSLRALVANSKVQFNNVYFDDNIIDTALSNSNLELVAAGSGKITLLDNNLLIQENLEAGTLVINNFNIQNSLQSNETVFSDNIKIFDNVITTTQTNSPLELRATGNIFLDSIEITSDRIRTTGQGLSLAAPLVTIDSSDAIKLPIGTTAQRPLANGSLRFNTNDFIFEGYGANKVFSLGGIFSENRRTSIIPNSNDNSISFNVNSVEVGKIDNSGLRTNGLLIEDILIDSNIIRTTASNSNLEFRNNGTGETVIDLLSIKDNIIKNNNAGSFTLTAQNFGVVKFRGAATVIPYGTSAERPVAPELGTTRWNTEENILEVWDGSTFISSGGIQETISASEFQDLMLEYTLIFG